MEQLARFFKIGSLMLPDMQPELPVTEAVMVYSANYPIVQSGILSDGELSDHPNDPDKQCMVYTVTSPPAKTKG